MNKVKHFVEISRKDFNQQKELKLEIESFALRKQLAKELMDIYKNYYGKFACIFKEHILVTH